MAFWLESSFGQLQSKSHSQTSFTHNLFTFSRQISCCASQKFAKRSYTHSLAYLPLHPQGVQGITSSITNNNNKGSNNNNCFNNPSHGVRRDALLDSRMTPVCRGRWQQSQPRRGNDNDVTCLPTTRKGQINRGKEGKSQAK